MSAVIDSIRNEPEKWVQTECTLDHENGFKLWTANGWMFCAPYPSGGFNILEKWEVWRAYKWWVRNAPLDALAGKRPKS